MILNAQHHLKCNYVLLVKIEQCDQNCYNNPSTLNKKHLKMEGMKRNNNNNDNKMKKKKNTVNCKEKTRRSRRERANRKRERRANPLRQRTGMRYDYTKHPREP